MSCRLHAIRHAGEIGSDAVTRAQALAFLAGSGPLTQTRALRYSVLVGFYRCAIARGYRTLENRAFNGPADRECWFCTLRVQAEDAGTVKPLLSMWQKRNDDHDLFHMVEEAASEEMEQPLRRWIDLTRKIAEIRGLR